MSSLEIVLAPVSLVTRAKRQTSSLSVAGAISVITNGPTCATHFGDGELSSHDVAASVIGAVVKDPVQDQAVWNEYLETAVKKRAGWKEFYAACREVS